MKRKIDPLQALRGFAALMVLLGHMQYGGIWPAPVIHTINLQWITFADMHVYVWIFFILSGYLIGKGFFTKRYKLTSKGLLRYFLKRVIRIVPVYYAVLTFNIIFFRLWTAKEFVSSIIQAYSFMGTGLVVTPGYEYLWAISAEMQWYLIAPVIFLFLMPFLKKKIFSVLILISMMIGGFGLYSYGFQKFYPFMWSIYLTKIYSPMIFNLDLFVFGMFLNAFVSARHQSTKKVSGLILLLQNNMAKLSVVGIGFLYLVTSYIGYQALMVAYFTFLWIKGILEPVVVMILVGFFIYSSEFTNYFRSYTLSKHVSVSLREFINPFYFFHWLGVISLELYLVHLPLMRIFNWDCMYKVFGCTTWQFLYRFAALAITSIIFAWFLHKGFSYITSRISRRI